MPIYRYRTNVLAPNDLFFTDRDKECIYHTVRKILNAKLYNKIYTKARKNIHNNYIDIAEYTWKAYKAQHTHIKIQPELNAELCEVNGIIASVSTESAQHDLIVLGNNITDVILSIKCNIITHITYEIDIHSKCYIIVIKPNKSTELEVDNDNIGSGGDESYS